MENSKKLIPYLLLGAAIFFGAGLYIGAYHYNVVSKVPILSQSKELRLSGFKYISPILDFETENFELRSFQSKVEDAVKQAMEKGSVTEASVYFRDLNNGPWYGVNPGAQFSPASLLKVPVMMSYYQAAQSDPSLLSQKIKYIKSDKTTDETSLVDNQEYTVDQLITIMITESDNEAKRLLTSNPSIDFQKPYSDLGISMPVIPGLDNNMSVKEYASFFRVLYNASYLNKEYSSKALELLTKTKFINALRAGVPEQIDVAHKYGERVLSKDIVQLHDCGIVYVPKHPYLICVMTRGSNVDNLEKAIKDISTLVYNEVQSQLNVSMHN